LLVSSTIGTRIENAACVLMFGVAKMRRQTTAVFVDSTLLGTLQSLLA